MIKKTPYPNYLVRDIPPDLYWSLKELALARRMTLKALVIEALQNIVDAKKAIPG